MIYKYEVYQVGKLPPLTIIKANNFKVDFKTSDVCFIKDNETIAIFNWNNIAGVKVLEIESEVETE
jgi:hypothetical protein